MVIKALRDRFHNSIRKLAQKSLIRTKKIWDKNVQMVIKALRDRFHISIRKLAQKV